MAGRRKNDEFNDREKRFIEEYPFDLNMTQAAIRAGYSPRCAKQIGSDLMSKPRIRTAIDKVLAERSRRTAISTDRILLELGRCGFYNALNFINTSDATVKSETSTDDGAVISSVKVKVTPTEDGNVVEREIKCVDKLKALELAGKHLGMFTDKQEHSGPGGGAIPIAVTVTYDDADPPAE